MSQRINITYGINFDELSEETRRLYKYILRELTKLQSSTELPDDFLSIKTLNDVKHLEERLSGLSSRASDLHSIIEAHLSYTLTPAREQTSEEEQLRSIKEKISSLQNIEATPDEIPT